MLHLQRKEPVWWATSLITFTSPPNNQDIVILSWFFVAHSRLCSHSQFGQGRFSLVAISFYTLSLLFGAYICHWNRIYIGRLSWSYVLGWTFLDLFYLLLMQPNLCWIIWFDQQSASKSLNESKFNCLLLSQIKIYTSSLLPDMTQKRRVDKKKKRIQSIGCFRSIIARWFTSDIQYTAFYAPG